MNEMWSRKKRKEGCGVWPTFQVTFGWEWASFWAMNENKKTLYYMTYAAHTHTTTSQERALLPTANVEGILCVIIVSWWAHPTRGRYSNVIDPGRFVSFISSPLHSFSSSPSPAPSFPVVMVRITMIPTPISISPITILPPSSFRSPVVVVVGWRWWL